MLSSMWRSSHSARGFSSLTTSSQSVCQMFRRRYFIDWVARLLSCWQVEDYGRVPVTVLGWGVENTRFYSVSDQLSTRLKKLELSQVPLWNCNEIYKNITGTDLK